MRISIVNLRRAVIPRALRILAGLIGLWRPWRVITNIEVQAAIVVDVTKGSTRRKPSAVCLRKANTLTDIFKLARPAKVSEQKVPWISRNQDVAIAIIVVVGDRNPMGKTKVFVQTTAFNGSCKCAISIVSEQACQRAGTGELIHR